MSVANSNWSVVTSSEVTLHLICEKGTIFQHGEDKETSWEKFTQKGRLLGKHITALEKKRGGNHQYNP